MASLKKLLEKTPVETLINCSNPAGSIIEVLSTDSVADGFKKLLDNGILSAPVFDTESSQYVGFLDLRDLASWAVFLFDEQEDDSDTLDIVNAAPRFFKNFAEGVNVKYLARRNTFKAVKEKSSLLDVTKILRLGVKRVPVLNDEGRVVGIISQSSVNKFLCDHTKALMGETSIPLSTLTIGNSPVLSATVDSTAIDTFRLMDNKHVSGVAVVDANGVIVANTSSRDLKVFIKTPKRSYLMLGIMNWLAELRKEGVGEETPVVTCTENETLAQAMAKIASTKVHRIYVLNSSGQPQRVVTLTDIMKYIA